jgi:ATP-dependent Clp protease protease subunit
MTSIFNPFDAARNNPQGNGFRAMPTIYEDERGRTLSYDIFSRLFKDRIIFMAFPINNDAASYCIAQMLYLEREDPEKDIHLYINSPGGEVYPGLAIYDTMQYIKPDISTTCVGMAASMAAVLLAGGTKGKRFALPNSKIMVHQPLGGAQGQASDVEILAGELLKIKSKLNEIISFHTGQKVDKVNTDLDRDKYMTAEEAKDYGLVDRVLAKTE